MTTRLPYVRLSLVLLLVFMLSIMPLPSVLDLFRPLWGLMFMLFIQLTMPSAFRIGLLLWVGLMLDVLSVSVMGQHPVALILTAWLASHWARRFNFFSVQQQMILMIVLCFVYQSVLYFFDMLFGYHASVLMYCAPIVSTTVVWLVVKPFVSRAFD
ncbi:MAG: rod shape-determining protein MreD [Legionellaceae bacterium]